jgi:hypothetical protein
MTEPTAAFWCRIPSRPNFGDALTPWLIQRLTGSYPKFLHASDPRHKYLVTGSVIGLATPQCTVWGAGIMNESDRVAAGIKVLAVRGPLSRERVLASGVPCPAVYGDPALLLPLLYAPPTDQLYSVGLALHFSDFPRILASHRMPDTIKLIDMQQPIEIVIDQIRSCEFVASSSLHGLIVSHAYGRPANWVEFRPLPSGDGSKFRDYLQSIGCRRNQPLRMTPDRIKSDFLITDAIEPPTGFDLAPLWESCPFPVRNETL